MRLLRTAAVAGAVLVGAVAGCTVPVPRAAPFDFDGDRRADLVWVDPTNGRWYREPGGHLLATDPPMGEPVSGDWNADGRYEAATVDPLTGNWRGLDGALYDHFPAPVVELPPGVRSGLLQMPVPVPADWDGDRRTDPAWYRVIDGTWFIRGRKAIQFGRGPTDPLSDDPLQHDDQDLPVPADYDGDGRADPAVYSPRTGEWRVLRADGGIDVTVLKVPDADTQLPVPADYDGDGRAERAVADDTGWTIEHRPFIPDPVAVPAWVLPAVADWDGDGRADPARMWDDGVLRYLPYGATRSVVAGFFPAPPATHAVPAAVSVNLNVNLARLTLLSRGTLP